MSVKCSKCGFWYDPKCNYCGSVPDISNIDKNLLEQLWKVANAVGHVFKAHDTDYANKMFKELKSEYEELEKHL